MSLRIRENIHRTGFRNLYPAREPRSRAVTQRVNVKAHGCASATGATATVAKEGGERIIGMTCLNPNWQLKRFPIELDLHHVSAFHGQSIGHLGRHLQRIVPGHLAERRGKFLQPAVVGELAVVNAGIATEVQLDSAVIACRGWRKTRCLDRDLFGLRRGPIHPAVVQRLAPPHIEVRAGVLRFPVILDDFVPAGSRLAIQQREQLVNTLAVVKRRNQRLDDSNGPVISARVTPRFQVMRFVHVPMAELGSFVVVKTEMNANRNVAVFERVGKAEIGRGIVNRIAAKDDQHVHLARAHVVDEIFQRVALAGSAGEKGVRVKNCLANIAELLVNRMSESVDDRWLMVSWHYNAGTAMLCEISGERDGKFDRALAKGYKRIPASRARRKQELNKGFDFDRLDCQPMVRLRPGRAWRALNHIKPTHLLGIRIAPLREIPRIPRRARKSS